MARINFFFQGLDVSSSIFFLLLGKSCVRGLDPDGARSASGSWVLGRGSWVLGFMLFDGQIPVVPGLPRGLGSWVLGSRFHVVRWPDTGGARSASGSWFFLVTCYTSGFWYTLGLMAWTRYTLGTLYTLGLMAWNAQLDISGDGSRDRSV